MAALRIWRSRAGIVALVIASVAAVGGGLATAADRVSRSADQPTGCVRPDRAMDLYAVQLPADEVTGQVRLGYGRSPHTASYPGPLIEMTEGECLAITLHNRVPAQTLAALRTDPNEPLGVSLHVHGVKYTQSSDGTVQSNSYVPPGGSRTYVWFAKKPDRAKGTPGTAGYWWYHDHVVGTSHGTQGIDSGLFGGLVVRRPGDPRPDRSFTVAFGDRQSINLRRGKQIDNCDQDHPVPRPTCLVAQQGQRVEFVVIGIGNDMHTFHLHGHSWADTRTGLIEQGTPWADSVPVIDTKPLGPGQTFGFQAVAGDSVGPGDWMLHCHMQFHADAGMSTMLHVLASGGVTPHGHD